MVKFLKFVHADLEDSTKDFEDAYVRKLQRSVQNIKFSREMEAKYMLLELLMKDEFKAGKAEGKAEDILELLEELGTVDAELETKIRSEKNMKTLSSWHKLAAKADSIEQFVAEM